MEWEPDLYILFDHYDNQLESLSSSGCCALTDNVSPFVITNMFVFFFCLNNVQYVIYGNSANKQWIELNCYVTKLYQIESLFIWVNRLGGVTRGRLSI